MEAGHVPPRMCSIHLDVTTAAKLCDEDNDDDDVYFKPAFSFSQINITG